MAQCTKCGKEIAQGATVCKHCGAQLSAPKRPTGVTVIAVLTLVGAVFALIAIPSLKPLNAMILGIRVPVNLARFVGLAFVGISIYCGIGFLSLKRLARQIYVWALGYSIVNMLINTPILMSTMGHRIPYHQRSFFYGSMLIGMLIGLSLSGYILYYIIRRKDYFVN